MFDEDFAAPRLPFGSDGVDRALRAIAEEVESS